MIGEGAWSLGAAIIMRAVEDYRDLKKQKKWKVKTKDEGTYSIGEIEKFFQNKWCADILRGIGAETTGQRILSHLRRSTKENKETDASVEKAS